MNETHRRSAMVVSILLTATLLPGLGLAASEAEEPPHRASAVFAGGCFWCMEKPFERLEGVVSVKSGYAGGHVEDPTYKQVSAGGTGHAEVIEVIYDPEQVSYEILLYVYWRNVDPLDGGGQFCDRGASYRPAIFYESEAQRELALESRKKVEQSLGESVAVEIEPLDTFYVAEDYHQDYYNENKIRYWYYRKRCGRDARLEEVWGEQAGGANPRPWLSGAS